MGPEVASVEIQNWRQKRRFEEALTIFELLKPEEKAPIIAFMLNSDEDSIDRIGRCFGYARSGSSS